MGVGGMQPMRRECLGEGHAEVGDPLLVARTLEGGRGGVCLAALAGMLSIAPCFGCWMKFSCAASAGIMR